MFSQDEINHFLTWGHYFKYPSCCINHFVTSRDREYFFNSEHPACGSGFVPCPCCFEKTVHMSLDEFVEWLGRNPFSGNINTSKETFNRTLEDRFIFYAKKYNIDLEGYRLDLKLRHIKRHGKF